MLTIFTVPKPFEGTVDAIQRNAIRSWQWLGSDCQIILCGDTPDLDVVAAELGVDRAAGIECNEFGTPLLSSAFTRAAQVARHELLCYANTDLIFLPDFLQAVRTVMSKEARFLIVGECWDTTADKVPGHDDPAARGAWETALRRHAAAAGSARGPEWIDYFVFKRGTIGPLPNFAVGRPGWDNWMIWYARSVSIPVVDISTSAFVVHQKHGYGHVPGARGSKWEGPEADANRALVGFRRNLFSLRLATHRLVGSTLVRNRTGSIGDRLSARLLLHDWTVPIYRMLRASYRLLTRDRTP